MSLIYLSRNGIIIYITENNELRLHFNYLIIMKIRKLYSPEWFADWTTQTQAYYIRREQSNDVALWSEFIVAWIYDIT
jgi:hypothetical protein